MVIQLSVLGGACLGPTLLFLHGSVLYLVGLYHIHYPRISSCWKNLCALVETDYFIASDSSLHFTGNFFVLLFPIAFEPRLFGYGEGDCNISASTDTILD